MELFKTLRQSLRTLLPTSAPKLKPVYPGKLDFAVEPAFELDGKMYWEISGGVLNAPPKRGLAAGDIYEEVEMRVTREYLKGHNTAMLEMLTDPRKYNLVTQVEMCKELDNRLEWFVSPEAIYKLASVVYFDENENPYEYNYKYNMEKIALWKNHKVADFFLQKPIRKLLPHSKLSDEDLVKHIETTMKLEQMQAESLLQVLSKANWTKDFYTILLSQAGMSR